MACGMASLLAGCGSWLDDGSRLARSGGGERAVITSLDRIADAVLDGRSESTRAEAGQDEAGTVVVAER